MSVAHYNDISEIPQHLLQQVHRFFEDYKKMEKKEVKVLEFAGR
jgi:inorganic pyrophosphatase